MALQAMKDVDWDEPVMAYPPRDQEWERTVTSALGIPKPPSPQLLMAPLPWLRSFALDMLRLPLVETPPRLLDLATFVTSQESACRFCWGVGRTQMRLLGYPEEFIEQVERNAKLADETEREVIRFCRNLARSNPRPARDELNEMLRLGLSPSVAQELAFAVAATCFTNRISTLLAAPPAEDFERMPDSFLGRVFRPLIAKKLRKRPAFPNHPPPEPGAPFYVITSLLGRGPAAGLLHQGLTTCFASPILPRRTKLLMFAVVAQSLFCPICEREARAALAPCGLGDEAVADILRTLGSPALDDMERKLIPWVRDTVRIDQPAPLQRQTRQLVNELGGDVMREAIGVASLANTTVRVAMLSE